MKVLHRSVSPCVYLHTADSDRFVFTVTQTDLDTETQPLSDSMAEAFAKYINELGTKDESGNVLTLTEYEDVIYHLGSHYDYLMGVVERLLNDFLEDTEFPYAVGNSEGRGFGGWRGNIGILISTMVSFRISEIFQARWRSASFR